MTKHERLLQAIRDAGWTLHTTNGVTYLATDPASLVELPTPDHISKRLWPFDTYQALRQLCLAVDGKRVVYVAAREGAPWTGASERRLSLAAAIAYVRGGDAA
jgi:hypothetical protein